MARLIDADAFIEYADKRLDIFADELKGMIDEQPTAYDVEKVVEELHELKDQYIDDCFVQKMMAIQKAIDIVRKGGVE